ncbi:hypothetical protein [Haloarcula sp. JP-L23]|uniref:hypothetical protein n=1 Tax=Haloarcula sp. JP-L23 TaxID=2716717 RepID=UPI00140F446C|nr:hypothetical protein G9465_25045 [Haloarcula sp. JP-L23]
MATQQHQMTAFDGTDLAIEHVGALDDDGARFEVAVADDGDDRRWRLDVQPDGSYEVVMSWNGGALADLATPDFVDEVVGRIV